MVHILYIAVIYNSVAETVDLCNSLANQESGSFDFSLILVDNSDVISVRSDIDALKQNYEFVKIFRPGGNLGYFPAISLALERHGHGYDFVVAGNNDLKYRSDFSRLLAGSSYSDEVMVVCPDVVTSDGVSQNPHHKNSITWLEKFYLDIYFSNYFFSNIINKIKIKALKLGLLGGNVTLASRGQQVAQEINQGVGAVYILTSKFLRAIDYRLYYPSFLYCEEACLSWQVHSVGGVTWYDPLLKVWHAESATLGKISSLKTYNFSRDSYWKIRDKI